MEKQTQARSPTGAATISFRRFQSRAASRRPPRLLRQAAPGAPQYA